MEVMQRQTTIYEHLTSVEAMIDFYENAFTEGSPNFRSASAVLDILMKVCRSSLYSAMEAVEGATSPAVSQPA